MSTMSKLKTFLSEASQLTQQLIHARPTTRIETRQLLQQSASASASSSSSVSSNGNSLAMSLLRVDKEIVYLQYEGMDYFVKRFRQFKTSRSTRIKSMLGGANGTGNSSTSSGATANAKTEKSSNDKVAKIAFMITKSQKQILARKLLYTEEQIRSLKPIEALLIVSHDLYMDQSTENQWRQTLDGLMKENDVLMEKQSGEGEARMEKEETSIGSTSSFELGFESSAPQNSALSTAVSGSGSGSGSVSKSPSGVDSSSTANALAIVHQDETQDFNTNTNAVTGIGTSSFDEAPRVTTAPISSVPEDKSESIVESSAKEDESDAFWYEVIQVMKGDGPTSASASASASASEVVALYKTQKEAEEYLEIKVELMAKRMERRKGNAGNQGTDLDNENHHEVEYRIRKRKA